MKKLILILSFVLLVGAAQTFAQCKDVRIQRGRISTLVKGITTKNYPCYKLRARFGQKINLHLSSDDASVKFSVSEDYYDAGFLAEDVRDWEGGLVNTNTLSITVGNGKRGSPFTLEITIR